MVRVSITAIIFALSVPLGLVVSIFFTSFLAARRLTLYRDVTDVDVLFDVLTALSCIACIFLLIFICGFLEECIHAKRSQTGSISIKTIFANSFSPIHHFFSGLLPKVGVVAAYVLMIAGLIHLTILLFFRNETIGSFYEKGAYESQYQCELTYQSNHITGYVTLERSSGRYYITKINIGKNLSAEYDAEYYPDSVSNTIVTNENIDWNITVSNSPCSIDYLYKINRRIHNKHLCASKNSNIYHNINCGYVRNIKDENLIFFDTKDMADLMKYSPCSNCGKWYSTNRY